MIDPTAQIAGLNESIKRLREDVLELKAAQKEIIEMLNDLSANRIARLERDLAINQERIAVLQRIVYGVVGAVGLAIVGAVINLIV